MIFVWNIAALFDDEIRERYLPFLDEQRRSRVKRFKFAMDRARCVGAGILLAEAYRQYQEKKRGEPAFADSLAIWEEKDIIRLNPDFFPKNPYDLPKLCVSPRGKPYFSSDKEPFFNLSHAHNLVACVIADCEVGIDIEHTRKASDSVVQRCFTEEEKQKLTDAMAVCKALQDEKEQALNKNRLFTALWTKKEAESKLDGSGIRYLYQAKDKGGQNSKATEVVCKRKEKKICTHTIWLSDDDVLSVAFYEDGRENRRFQ